MSKCKEIFIPTMRKKIYHYEELVDFIELYNGKKNIYDSVYWYHDEPNSKNAIVDKIFLDFDYDDDFIFLDNIRRIAKVLHRQDIRFYIRFSGRGFHLFILLEDKKLKNPKAAIRKYVNELHNRTDTTSDVSVIGDTRRVCRSLYTKNLKTKLYCIPLSYDDLIRLTYYEICDKAKTCPSTKVVYDILHDGDLLDISKYDEDIVQGKQQNIYVDVSNIKIDNEFPPCIKRLLSISDLGYHERMQVICYLRDDGYLEEEIESILEQSLSVEKFIHCIEEERQLRYLMNRDDVLFSSCQTLKATGLCPSTQCPGQNLYL